MTALGSIPVASLPDVVRNGQCIGCGFCQIPIDPAGDNAKVSLEFSPREEHWVPHVTATELDPGSRRICPGAVMDMVGLSNRVFGAPPSDPVLGEHLLTTAGHATDPEVRKAAASGGVTSALLSHLFDTREIDVAYCAFGRSPDDGHGALVRTASDLRLAMGSHYHPVDFGRSLAQLCESNDRFAFVGLPCEVAALRALTVARPDIASRCVVTIGLFCGGINRFSGIGRYLSNFDVDPSAVKEIDYRDGVWPGQIAARTATTTHIVPRIFKNTRWRILRYVISFQGYWMLPRCRICPDQIADFADISVGDPHLGRFKSNQSLGHSALIARTENGKSIVLAAAAAHCLALESLSRQEIVQSQGYTLENRRQASLYARVAKSLGMIPPNLTTYEGLSKFRTAHQTVYAYVDLLKIRVRHWRWLRPFYLPLQVFEYLFLTFSLRVLIQRLKKLVKEA